MKPLVVGTREDVAGFALAGIEGVVGGMSEALGHADEETLLIVSNELAVGGWRLAEDHHHT